MTAALPRGWHQAALGDLIVSLRNGIFARRPNDEQRGVPILRISAVRSGSVDLHDRRFVDGVDDKTQGHFAIQEGDLLVTRYNGSRSLVGVCGRVGRVTGITLHPDKLIRLIPDHTRVDGKFLALQMQSPAVREYLEPRIRTTAGQSGISGSDVRSVPLTVPPLDEQRRIVAVLEDHFSRLDAARHYLDAAASRSEALRQARFEEALQEPGLEHLPLGELLADPLGNGRSVPDGDGAKVLRLGALRGEVVDVNVAKTGAWSAAEAAPFRIQRGDLLLARGNGSRHLVGRASLVRDEPPPVSFPDTMIRVRPDVNKIGAALLTIIWNSAQVRRQVEVAARTTAGILKINQRQIAAIRVPVPSRARQDAVLAALLEADTGNQRLQRDLSRARSMGAALRRSLLSTAFNGQL